MELSFERADDVRIVRVKETKLTYPVLSSFFLEVRGLVEQGARKLLFDLGAVGYVDSAAIGCLIDIHRLLAERGGAVKLSGLQPRVETMITITGLHKVLELHRHEAVALASFAPNRAAAGQAPGDARGPRAAGAGTGRREPLTR